MSEPRTPQSDLLMTLGKKILLPYTRLPNARAALLWHYQILTEASFNLLGVLAGLNHLYFTPFQFKKMHRFIHQMQIVPPNLAERLEELFAQAPAEAAGSLESLVSDVIALVQAHMPDVDVSVVKKSLGQRRAPWQSAELNSL